MQFALFNLMTMRDRSVSPKQVFDDTVAMVRLADDIGFDTAWFAEHHFSNYSICASPMMMAAHCAGMTKQIRLGAAVLVLPLYNPVRMVQEIGMLDVQSGGRAVIGIGCGYQGYEFKRFDHPLEERNAVSMEVWDIMEQALTTGAIEYHGQYFDIPASPLSILPLQKPMPELFVTGLAPAIVQRAVKGGYTPFITGGWKGLPALKEMRSFLTKQHQEAGVDPETMPLAIQQYIHVTDDPAEGLDFAERARFTGRIVTQMRAGDPILDGPFIQAPPIPDEPALEVFRDNLVVGPPEYCAERIVEEIRTLNVSHYSCFMQVGSLDGRRALTSLERFGAEVLPLVEREIGPTRAATADTAAE